MPRITREEVTEEAPRRWPIAAILLAALALRLFGISYGTPYAYDPKEERVVRQGYYLAAWSPKPAEADKPVMMSYIVAGEYGAFFGVEHLFGRVGGRREFRALYYTSPSTFVILARLAAVLFGVLTVYLVFFLGKQHFGWGAGIAAAALVAFSPQHIRMSQTATGDVLALFLATASLYFLLMFALEKHIGHLFMGALMAGLAAGAQYEYAVFVILVFIAYFVIAPREYKKSAVIFGVPFAVFCFAFGMLAPNGILLLKPHEFLEGVKVALLTNLDPRALLGAGALEPLKALVSRDFHTLALGWALVVAGILGIIWGLATARWKRTQFALVALALLIPAAAFFPFDSGSFVRWAALLVVPLSLGAAYLGYRLFWRKRVPAAVGVTLLILFTAGVAAQGALEAGIAGIRNPVTDTRRQFTDWALQNVPDGAPILATENARFVLSEYDISGGAMWESFRSDILSHRGGRAYKLRVLQVPPAKGVIPDVAEFAFVAVDDWSVARLRQLKNEDSAAALAIVDAARASGREVETFEVSSGLRGGGGPRISVYRMPFSADSAPSEAVISASKTGVDDAGRYPMLSAENSTPSTPPVDAEENLQGSGLAASASVDSSAS